MVICLISLEFDKIITNVIVRITKMKETKWREKVFYYRSFYIWGVCKNSKKKNDNRAYFTYILKIIKTTNYDRLPSYLSNLQCKKKKVS